MSDEKKDLELESQLFQKLLDVAEECNGEEQCAGEGWPCSYHVKKAKKLFDERDSSLAHNPQWLAENGLVGKEGVAEIERKAREDLIKKIDEYPYVLVVGGEEWVEFKAKLSSSAGNAGHEKDAVKGPAVSPSPPAPESEEGVCPMTGEPHKYIVCETCGRIKQDKASEIICDAVEASNNANPAQEKPDYCPSCGRIMYDDVELKPFVFTPALLAEACEKLAEDEEFMDLLNNTDLSWGNLAREMFMQHSKLLRERK